MLDRNLLETEPMEIAVTALQTTILGGRVVFDARRDKTVDLIDESDYLDAKRAVH